MFLWLIDFDIRKVSFQFYREGIGEIIILWRLSLNVLHKFSSYSAATNYCILVVQDYVRGENEERVQKIH